MTLSAAAASLSATLCRAGKASLPNVPTPALHLFVTALELFVDRFTGEAAHDDISALLRRAPFSQQVAVLRAARELRVASIGRLASIEIAALLRDRPPDVQRVVLDEPDDLTADEKRSALAEALLTPELGTVPSDEAAATASESADDDARALAECAAELDARSLRSLKAVSRRWRHRVRVLLSDPASAWRRAPEWSAGEWARTSLSARLEPHAALLDPADAKRALLETEALEASVELPEFAPRMVRLLQCTPPVSASCRKLAVRALDRLETPTLRLLHAPALRRALASFEEWELEAEATRRLVGKLGGGEWGEDGGGAPPAGQKRRRSEATAEHEAVEHEAPEAAASLEAGDLRHALRKRRAARACDGGPGGAVWL